MTTYRILSTYFIYAVRTQQSRKRDVLRRYYRPDNRLNIFVFARFSIDNWQWHYGAFFNFFKRVTKKVLNLSIIIYYFSVSFVGMEQIELKDNVIVEDISVSFKDMDSIESTGMDTKSVLGFLPVVILLIIMFLRLIFVIYKSNGELIFLIFFSKHVLFFNFI